MEQIKTPILPTSVDLLTIPPSFSTPQPLSPTNASQNPSPTFKPQQTPAPRSAWSDLFQHNNSNW
ncbi:hypothetical protein FRX31_006376 [Thalictrum thalictroides]|uniref:Uncharacterized protein n=1 Tax=Thalictrum thalictroides TaxID=46969 RepID=A0A7J6X2R4_THATH|nr:hypothetical protein FRX31_006376 [Thalictrum thalictroides]